MVRKTIKPILSYTSIHAFVCKCNNTLVVRIVRIGEKYGIHQPNLVEHLKIRKANFTQIIWENYMIMVHDYWLFFENSNTANFVVWCWWTDTTVDKRYSCVLLTLCLLFWLCFILRTLQEQRSPTIMSVQLRLPINVNLWLSNCIFRC